MFQFLERNSFYEVSFYHRNLRTEMLSLVCVFLDFCRLYNMGLGKTPIFKVLTLFKNTQEHPQNSLIL